MRRISEDLLLSKLAELSRVKIEDKSELSDGSQIILIGCYLPFPMHRHVWYALFLEDGQTEIEEPIVEKILRRFWHLEKDFFEDMSDAL